MATEDTDLGAEGEAEVAAPVRVCWGYPALAWALLFSALHIYWALGGSWMLASSAGLELTQDRPLWFVLFGLWGVALVLVAGAVLGLALARGHLSGRAARVATALCFLVGAVLLVRGVGVEVLLLTDAFGVARNVGADQVRASLVMWNPWFIVGGLAFALAGIEGRRGRTATPLPSRHPSWPR